MARPRALKKNWTRGPDIAQTSNYLRINCERRSWRSWKEEKFYVDESMMSPALSSDAVWRLITEIDDGEAGALVLWRHPARRL